jgi:methylated-DNA-[protein]-cysteine S-methyltransferase
MNHKQIIADPLETDLHPAKEWIREESLVYGSPIGFIQINAAVYSTEANPANPIEYITSIRFFDTDPGSTETASPTLKKAWEQIKAYFETGLKEFSFPILQPGTHFQMAVWKELLDIPYGKTISYLQLAQKLGDPKKIRAAGSANGKNNIAIVVPCHRVIGSTGELVGYAGSLWRKEWLLIHEGVLPKKLF